MLGSHFGILCPAAIGHLNPMCTLGRELQRRGHRVTLLGIPDVRSKVIGAGLDFETIGEVEFPLGSLEQYYQQLGELSGSAGLKFTVGWFTQEMAMHFRDVPSAIKSSDIKALLVDQATLAGSTIAEFLNLPFITRKPALAGESRF